MGKRSIVIEHTKPYQEHFCRRTSLRGSTTTDFPDRTFFMNMFNNAREVADVFNNFKPGYWCYTGPRSDQSNHDTVANTRGKWDAIAEKMTDIFAQSGHPAFPSAEKMKKGTLKSKGGETLHSHFNAGPENEQMLMRLILSCNQWCSFSRPNPRRTTLTFLHSDREGSQRVGDGDLTSTTT